MKTNYCSRCNLPYKKLYNCKYEEHHKDWFLLCYNCVLDCKSIYKQAFISQLQNVTTVRMIKSRKERGYKN